MIDTIESAAAAMRAGTLTAAALTEQSLAAIAAHGVRTNAFILVDAEGAREAAATADAERRRGVDRGPMHGVPVSIKDLIDVAGQPTTAASRVRSGHRAEHDAPLVSRLRNAGAIIIGKTNLHEFALGTTSEESAFGAVRNPLDTARSAGGSSGGSAAAVATGMGLASVGTDTGGSIRIPAAACGIVGLKPSRNDVPLDGVVPLCPTFDHAGPLTHTVYDAAVMWAVLSDRAMPPLATRAPASVTLGELGGYFTALLDDDVRTAFGASLVQLRHEGAALKERVIQNSDAIVVTYANVSLAEAALWHAQTLDTRPDDYHPNVRARLEAGRNISAVSYLRAREVRETLVSAVDAALLGCDALILPTLPIVAPVIGSVDAVLGAAENETLTVRAAMLRLTQVFNITGHPAITIPIGGARLPAALQLVGHRDRTAELLDVAYACERVVTRR